MSASFPVFNTNKSGAPSAADTAKTPISFRISVLLFISRAIAAANGTAQAAETSDSQPKQSVLGERNSDESGMKTAVRRLTPSLFSASSPNPASVKTVNTNESSVLMSIQKPPKPFWVLFGGLPSVIRF
jgi:hypothetical protein